MESATKKKRSFGSPYDALSCSLKILTMPVPFSGSMLIVRVSEGAETFLLGRMYSLYRGEIRADLAVSGGTKC
jgi:hypothetical protein